MRSRTKSKIFTAIPIIKIVSGLKAVLTKRGNLVMQKSVRLQNITQRLVLLLLAVLVGKYKLLPLLVKRRALLDLERIRGYVVNPRGDYVGNNPCKFLCGLVGKCENNIRANVFKANPPCAFNTTARVGKAVNTPYKLRRMDQQMYMDETEDSFCVWRTFFSERTQICTYQVDLFQEQEDGAWERSFEEHCEYAYSAQQLVGYLKDAGFTHIRVYGDRRMEAPKEGEQRIYIKARKGKIK